jgi:hypothetical protein
MCAVQGLTIRIVYRYVEFAEHPPLQLQSGQQVSIHCGGRNITFFSESGPVVLNNGSTLALYGCRASFFKVGYSDVGVEIQHARDMTRTSLVGVSGALLSLQNSTLLMPAEVRIYTPPSPILCNHLKFKVD